MDVLKSLCQLGTISPRQCSDGKFVVGHPQNGIRPPAWLESMVDAIPLGPLILRAPRHQSVVPSGSEGNESR